jgi:hypothetical protein
MASVRKWEYHDESEKEQLRQWYMSYWNHVNTRSSLRDLNMINQVDEIFMMAENDQRGWIQNDSCEVFTYYIFI